MSTTKISLRYFAKLAEECGKSEEQRVGEAQTALAWFELLAREYGWSLSAAQVRAALDGRYVAWESKVPDGATLAFIPPVSGG